MKYFGAQYDIHGGAIELAFPHHEAEIAQAEATTGVKPYVRYWVHTGLLTINKTKMSKSLGNVLQLSDVLEKHGAETLRLWIASTHYRKPLDYNEKDLDVAKKKIEKIASTLERIKESVDRPSKKKVVFVKQIQTLRKEFLKAMENDVNTPLALTYFFEIISLVNKQIDQNSFSKDDLEAARKTIHELGEFFQIIPEIKEEKLPTEVEKLIKEREEARKKKDWKKADALREKIRELGYALEDTVEGVRWKKLN